MGLAVGSTATVEHGDVVQAEGEVEHNVRGLGGTERPDPGGASYPVLSPEHEKETTWVVERQGA